MVVVLVVIHRRHFTHQHIAKTAFTPETVVQARRQTDTFPWLEAQLAAGRYAAEDADVTLQLHLKMWPKLEKIGRASCRERV